MRRPPFALLLLGILSFLPCRLFCQPYWESIDLYTTRNGLPNNSILSIYQDSKGFLWVGTYNGLSRYDGNGFKNFKNEWHGKDRGWLYSVSVITEDKDSNIWVGTRGGIVAKLDDKTGEWTWTQLEGDVISDILFDEDNSVWVGTRMGYIGKFENNKFVKKCNVRGIVKIFRYSASELLIVADSPYVFNKVSGSVKPLADKNIPDLRFVEGMFCNGKELFFFLTTKSVVSYDIRTREKRITRSAALEGLNIFKNLPGISASGNLLLINKNNLVDILPDRSHVSTINLEEGSGSFNASIYNVLFEDKSGLVWVGTNYGLFKVDRRKIAFKKYTSNNIRRKLKHNYIRALYTQKNELWIGTKEGEIGKIIFNTLSHEPVSQRWYAIKKGDGTRDHEYTINSIVSDADGNIWAGGAEGLFVLKKGGLIFEYVTTFHDDKPIPVTEIWSLTPDKKGNLFIGTIRHGLLVLDRSTRAIRQCLLDGKKSEFPVWNVFISSDGATWVGTGNGLYQAKDNSATQSYDLRPYMKEQFLKDVWSIAEDENKNIWIGTTSTGIYMLDIKTGTLYNHDKNNRLAENIVSGVIPDMRGNIWVSTVNGLSRFEIRSGKITNFDEGDGLVNNDFNFKACALAPWGEIYFGTKVGISSFAPGAITISSVSDAPVVITELWVRGIKYSNAEPLKLSYNNNNVSFRFAVLEFSKPFSHTYKYMLKGFDTEWQNASYDNPTAVYTNLPAGDYTLMVQASPDGRIWSTKKAEASFVIQPVLWMQPLFWIIFGGSFFLVSGLFVRSRVRSVIRKEKEKTYLNKHLAELEMKALSAQMNPHFIFNAIGAIQHYIVKNDVVSANEYLSRFAKLMRLFLRSSRSKFIPLKDEISLLELYITLEQLRFEGQFEFTIAIDDKLVETNVEIPTMLIQPFVENAINHGLLHKPGKGKLALSFRYNPDQLTLVCIIEDDGVGRRKANELRMQDKPTHTSAGTKLVEERVTGFNDTEDMKIELRTEDKYSSEGEPDGTIVEITIFFIKEKK